MYRIIGGERGKWGKAAGFLIEVTTYATLVRVEGTGILLHLFMYIFVSKCLNKHVCFVQMCLNVSPCKHMCLLCLSESECVSLQTHVSALSVLTFDFFSSKEFK